MFSRILVPIDLDNVDQLKKALGVAAQLAKDNDAIVTYVAIVDAVPTSSTHSERDKVQARLDSFTAEQASTHGIKTADHVMLRGDLHLHVGKEIIQTAQNAESDLIVMASHMPGLKDHVFSSNAGYVATHAPICVYVIR